MANDRISELSDKWNDLHSVVFTEGVTPRVSPLLASIVQQQYDKWRAWLGNQGPLDSILDVLPQFGDSELALQERAYNATRTTVTTEIAANELPPASDVGGAIDRAAEAAIKAAKSGGGLLLGVAALAAGVAVFLKLKK